MGMAIGADRAVKPRLHLVYYLLAAFDLAAICVSLYVLNELIGSYGRSVVINQQWAERLSDCSKLGALVAAVNAPGNDIFASGDADGEEARLRHAVAAMHDFVEEMRVELRRSYGGEQLIPALERVPALAETMVAEAHEIFALLRKGQASEAAARMAAMDRAFADANVALAALGAQVRAVQMAQLHDQAQTAGALRRFEIVVAGLIVLMIGGVVVYGHKLAGRIKENELAAQRREDLLEQRVQERTSELRQTHEQLRQTERLAATGVLAAGLGHDMNNLLFPIRCQLDALDANAAGEDTRKHTGEIRTSVRYLQQLSDGLRMLALDPHDGSLSGPSTDLRAWWQEVAAVMKSALPRQVELRSEIEADLPEVAMAAHALTQMVFNLVVNAGEALGERGVIRISANADGRAIRLAVADDGVGMREDVRARALEPFFTTKTRGLSTGLGLSLAHSLAKAARGELSITSAPGRGTTVVATLPASEAKRDTPGARTFRARVTLSDARVSALVVSLLHSASCAVVAAADGDDAELWISDDLAERRDAIRSWKLRRPDGMVLLIGQDERGWDELDPLRVPAPMQIESLRSAIQTSLEGLR